ncbi:hypothetical protein H8B06_04370 [Sphingobacterium sp. DN00404]|uniref:Bacterial surface antigen (D15) domain-containing protein n=1 Tax=Sphingobacterium micropteri TaxID=2763501 RepID=A0ABR7YL57_9SPHI|nr:hypothetical protein [Sphingobacterium micropteri]MBD1432050.1 hypothetical protein [Sphingobacterium micropteri]
MQKKAVYLDRNIKIRHRRFRFFGLVESEYRRDITRGLNTELFGNWNVGTGAGARINFNKKSGTNIAIDYGVSKGYRGFRLGLGEVF